MPVGLYIHTPFCKAKCYYCDFASFANLDGLFNGYTEALVREVSLAAPQEAKTIYIGGGTPTVLPFSHLKQIVSAANRAFAVADGTEVSIEANPGTVNARLLSDLRVLGVTRLSLGVQSFDDRELQLLGRIHTAAEAVDAYQAARTAGFDNVNLDLIFGLPGQALSSWKATLQRAVALEPDHLSLYALTVEENTPLARFIARGDLAEPDPDLAADMYELAESRLSTAGYVHYEISNWAASLATVCEHNLTYWRNEPYLGFGAGAHSWAGGRRWWNVTDPAVYVERISDGRDAVAGEETIGYELEIGETMMMGLRLLQEGVSYERFSGRFGVDLRERFAAEIGDLVDRGLLVAGEERVKLTEHGRLLGNRVFAAFLPDTAELNPRQEHTSKV